MNGPYSTSQFVATVGTLNTDTSFVQDYFAINMIPIEGGGVLAGGQVSLVYNIEGGAKVAVLSFRGTVHEGREFCRIRALLIVSSDFLVL